MQHADTGFVITFGFAGGAMSFLVFFSMPPLQRETTMVISVSMHLR
jgi:hypothetical protein